MFVNPINGIPIDGREGPVISSIPNTSGRSDGALLALHRSILLASDASPAAYAATRVTASLASRWSVTPQVCTVVPPPPIALGPAGAIVAYAPSIEEELRLEVGR